MDGVMVENKVLAEVKRITDVFELGGLVIPKYQRPYKWSLKHVNQLLDDLLFHMDKEVSRYRVGTVVLHQETPKDKMEAFNIVDGQQRLVTFSLILYALGGKSEDSLLNKAFNSLKDNTISCVNLQNNYAAIHQRIGGNYAKKDGLRDFILKHCELVVVTLDNISEAFQFFDSQNARGKGLEPYDLLKAFHLREMANNTADEKLVCVDIWEKSVESKHLKPLFNDYLYRIRRWLRSESGLKFTNPDIDLFKGVTLNKHEHRYPYVQPYRMLEAFFAGNAQVISAWETMPSYPFQINQTMINGKRFFEYVAHYESLLETIKDQQGAIFNILDTYEGHDRTGDQYTRNLLNATLLCFIDRFGVERLDSATSVCFEWAYAIRFEKSAVQKITMDNKGKSGFLMQMQYANYPSDIMNMTLHLPLEKDVKEQGKDLYSKYKNYREVKHVEK